MIKVTQNKLLILAGILILAIILYSSMQKSDENEGFAAGGQTSKLVTPHDFRKELSNAMNELRTQHGNSLWLPGKTKGVRVGYDWITIHWRGKERRVRQFTGYETYRYGENGIINYWDEEPISTTKDLTKALQDYDDDIREKGGFLPRELGGGNWRKLPFPIPETRQYFNNPRPVAKKAKKASLASLAKKTKEDYDLYKKDKKALQMAKAQYAKK